MSEDDNNNKIARPKTIKKHEGRLDRTKELKRLRKKKLAKLRTPESTAKAEEYIEQIAG